MTSTTIRYFLTGVIALMTTGPSLWLAGEAFSRARRHGREDTYQQESIGARTEAPSSSRALKGTNLAPEVGS